MNIEDPFNVASALHEIDKPADLVAITRGGGDSMNNLDDPALISAVSKSAFPIAVAVGHQSDTLVLEEVADIVFGTSKLGEFLRKMAAWKALKNHISSKDEIPFLERSQFGVEPVRKVGVECLC